MQHRWKGWSEPHLSISPELRDVADCFANLQQARHLADYNNGKPWAQFEVDEHLDEVRDAFYKWESIQGSAVANEYLLSLMIGKPRT